MKNISGQKQVISKLIAYILYSIKLSISTAWRKLIGEVRPRRRFCGGGASWYLLIDATYCHFLIYTPFGGLQSRGAGLARLAGSFLRHRLPRRRFVRGLKSSPVAPQNHRLFFCGEDFHRFSLDIHSTLFKKKAKNIGVLRRKLSS